MSEVKTVKDGKEFGIRLPKELKRDCIAFCNANNITTTDLIKALIEYSVANNRLPFDTHSSYLKELEKNGRKADKIHIRFNDENMLNEFKTLCSKLCLSYSVAIKAYIDLCVKKQKVICEKDPNSELYSNREYLKFEKMEKVRNILEKDK